MGPMLFRQCGYRVVGRGQLLRAKGFADVSDLIGGYHAWATLAEDG